MNSFKKYTLAAASLLMLTTACEKVDDLPFYPAAKNAVTLSTANTNIVPTAADSNRAVLTLNWTNPEFTTPTDTKYTIEIDSATKNFTKALIKVVNNDVTTAMLGKEINVYLLNRGYVFNGVYDLDVRVTASLPNNNQQVFSNIQRIKYKIYVTPPKVGLPEGGKLWANGGGLPWSWTDSPPTPQSEFSKVDSVTWAGVFNLGASNEFLVLSQRGSGAYDKKYALPNGNAAGIREAGDFGFYPPGTGGDNFKTPTNEGWYTMTMNYQTGRYTIAPFAFTGNALPQDLYITGDGTPSSWTNSPPVTQKFTRLNSCEYEITMAFVPGKFYKFLSSFGNWQPQFAGKAGTTPSPLGDELGANYGSSDDPKEIATPSVAGNYKITVNFATKKYQVIKL
jgi:starch-binding outer membrane protein SusE/F